MENALWNEQLLIAADVAKEYLLEKQIRKASGRKELRCPDLECQHPLLRYCHGEIKDPYFAHLNNEQCDYATFDKENTRIMRLVRRTIYENFRNKGYNVHPEVKILAHHYTHLLFDMADCSKIAVEIGTQQLSANRIDSMTDEYHKAGLNVKWIVLGNTDTPVRENHTFFLKRYLLNESKNKDLLIVNLDGIEVAQYKSDPNKYEHKGQIFSSDNYPDTYSEYATLNDLTFENNELTFAGYHDRYRKWLATKSAAFNKKIKLLEEVQRQKHLEEIRLQAQERQRILREQEERNKTTQQRLFSPQGSISKVQKKRNSSTITTLNPAYEKYRQEILPRMDQQEEQVRDSLGRRWIKCEHCGVVETEDKFCFYGGNNHVNLGICYNCSSKNRNT